jgi:hypothetical protein
MPALVVDSMVAILKALNRNPLKILDHKKALVYENSLFSSHHQVGSDPLGQDL